MGKKLISGMSALTLAAAATAASFVTTVNEKTAEAQAALPTPRRFVSALDLKCYKTQNVTQTPSFGLQLRHLNPVLQNLPVQNVVVRELQELCVPVAKNNVMPPADVLPFVSYVDLACHRIEQVTPPTVNLQLRHLNPVLQNLPVHNVLMTVPQQLCLPVAKNNVIPPAAVLNLIRHIDLQCFALSQVSPANFTLLLRHLNPVLQQLGLPTEQAYMTLPEQLCVPVAKNNQLPPADVLDIVRWLDLEMYRISAATPPLPAPVPLTLRHLNPLLTGLPQQQIQLIAPVQLGVPVAKNNLLPPG